MSIGFDEIVFEESFWKFRRDVTDESRYHLKGVLTFLDEYFVVNKTGVTATEEGTMRWGIGNSIDDVTLHTCQCYCPMNI